MVVESLGLEEDPQRRDMSPEMGHWVPAVTSASLNLQVTVTSEIGAGFALLLLSGLVANGRPCSQQVGMLEQFSSVFLFQN